MPTLHTDSGRVRYAAYGSGDRPVVFVHGGFFSRRVWDRQLAEFRGETRVLAMDLRGHGASTGHPGPFTPAGFADDLHAVLDAEGVENATLVGWSLGVTASVAYLDAYEDAGRVGRAMLVCSDLFRGIRDPESADALDVTSIADAFRDDYPAGMQAFVNGIFRGGPSDTLGGWFRSQGLRTPLPVALDVLDIYANADYAAIREQFENIHCPVLVGQGAFDDAASVEDAAFVAESVLDEGEFVAFEESAHVPFVEEREAFERALAAFHAR